MSRAESTVTLFGFWNDFGTVLVTLGPVIGARSESVYAVDQCYADTSRRVEPRKSDSEKQVRLWRRAFPS
jgi:hypothetical protein